MAWSVRPRSVAMPALILLLTLTACGQPSRERGPQAGTGREDVPSALDNPNNPVFPEPLIDPDDLASGGPPPDGIPPIDDPKFQSAQQVDWLAATEPVLSLTMGAETRAYPLQVMTWHEIVNDTVGGIPVAVTYCPLCNSGVAFERQVGKRLLDFGTSGLLYVDNLVMYDRQTETLWPQLTGEASIGMLTGTRLRAIPIGVTGWAQFREAHPEALVLTRDTGFDRSYGANPYIGYDDPDGDLLVEPPDGRDGRLPIKARVIGLRVGDVAIAVPRAEIARAGVIELSLGGQDLVLWHVPGQASALDSDQLAEGQEIGTVGVFKPSAAGRKLTFSRSGQGFIDSQTGSTWNALGEATRGRLAGHRLPMQQHLDTFWFAWVGFQPETMIHAP